MKTIRYIAIAIVLGILGLWAVLTLFVIYIPVGQVGVLTKEYSVFGKKGVVQEDFHPGWHLDLGPLHSWNRFDSTVQTLEMTRDPARGEIKGRDDVQVQSADGYAVSVDVTVKYRIANDMAHKLYKDTGSGDKYKVLVRNQAQKACQGLFGQMKTEEFYDPKMREEKAEEAKVLLADSLKENFVEVIDVLIRNVQFDPEYENKIRRKKLADQEVELNISMAEAEKMSGKTQVIEAETQKLLKIIDQEKEAALVTMEAEANRKIAKIKADCEKYATQKRADADLTQDQKEAQGKLLVKTAEAEGEKLRNEAMRGVGGSTIVALEAARNLNLDNVVVSTVDTDFLDLEKMATKLGVAKGKDE